MEELKERVKLFCEHPFFESRPALVVALLSHEHASQLKLPNDFRAQMLPLYKIGERSVEIGKIHNVFVFGLDFEDGHWEYRVFETRQDLKLFFSGLDGIDPEERAFWLSEVDQLPQR